MYFLNAYPVLTCILIKAYHWGEGKKRASFPMKSSPGRVETQPAEPLALFSGSKFKFHHLVTLINVDAWDWQNLQPTED